MSGKFISHTVQDTCVQTQLEKYSLEVSTSYVTCNFVLANEVLHNYWVLCWSAVIMLNPFPY